MSSLRTPSPNGIRAAERIHSSRLIPLKSLLTGFSMSESIWTPVVRHNVRVETLFSAFNGVFMALAIQASPMIAVSAVKASPIEVTMLVSAFPVGVFLGPVWAALGRGWGMRRLVTAMAIVGSLPLFALSWFETSWAFTLLVAFAQVMNSAMRMGQSSLYAVLYPRPVRGRVIGRFTFWTYLTMVPTIFIAGWCVGRNPSSFHILYPLAGACGLVGAWFYSGITLPSTSTIRSPGLSMRAAVQGVWKALGKDRAYRVFQIAYFLSGASFFMSTHVILLLATSELQFRPLELAISLTLIPQLVLAVSSPLWGHIYDRIGILNCRVLISVIATVYLLMYLAGVVFHVPMLIYLGSALFGFGNAGGQLTWALGSSHFAPTPEDVPTYNGVHFVLNGIRGLVVPWIGSMLLFSIGPWSLLAAALTSLASVLASVRSLQIEKLQPKTTS